MIGRPSGYTEDLADEICTQVACSPYGLDKILKKNPHFPSQDTIYAWRRKHKSFSESYARAKAEQVDVLVEEALRISLDGSKDTYIDEKGKSRCDHEWVNRCRLAVDTIKWIACKLAPKIYGERLSVENVDPEHDKVYIAAKERAKKISDARQKRRNRKSAR